MSDAASSSDAAASAGQRFSSRWALLLSVLGIAVGTGNIWRFPRIAAENGGDAGAGAFLVAWVVCLLAWSLPLIIAEYALGQRGRKGIVGTFVKVAGPKFAWMGAFVGFVAAAIMCYYAVVAGWCFFYFGSSLLTSLPPSTDAAMQTWDGFQATGWPVAFHLAAMSIAAIACSNGVSSIEKANKVLVPTLLGIVVLAVTRALTLPGATEGLAYLFTPEWSQLSEASLWIEALTQNAWDTGAGWGLILTYAAYMQKEHGVVRNAVLTGVGNNTVSLLAATMIFGTVFAVLGAGQGMARPEILEVMRTSGPAGTGLTFIWMPQLFAEMPLGRLLSVLFFLALSFAALSSLISMVELVSRSLVDFGVKRRTAVLSVVGVGGLIGLPSAINLDVFVNQDNVWGVALILSGLFIAVTVATYGARKLREDMMTPGDWRVGAGWDTLIRFLIPIEAVVLLLWWLSFALGGRWYDPIQTYSLGTFIVQWGGVLLLLTLLNNWMVRRLGENRLDPNVVT